MTVNEVKSVTAHEVINSMVFIGGGAMLLRKYLESSDKIGRSIFVEDICANAKGYGLLYQIQRKGR